MAKKKEDEAVDAGEFGDTDAAQGEYNPPSVGQGESDDDRDTKDIGAPGDSARPTAEALVEADSDGVPHATGDFNAIATGVTSDIVNPAFGGPAPGE